MAALQQVCSQENVELVYVTYHVDVGETPFFIGIDYDMSKIVISIRGTLSMKDIMTDLNAESELLPLQPVREEWKGHKGMVQAAEYIHGKLIQENLLEKAFNWRKDRGTDKFALVCVGHSLGGGTAAILAIILRQQYPDVTCYSYSPPGGLLSEEAMLASREFMTSVVVGKDVVPRIGMHQLETLRHDLMETIKKSEESKWTTIARTMACCSSQAEEEGLGSDSATAAINVHPMDCSVNLSVHQPLYPPGRIIHIVRHHPKKRKRGNAPVYQAVWADNRDFDQVLISKRMVQDHMPDNVLDALEKASSIHAWHTVSTFQGRRGVLLSNPKDGKEISNPRDGKENEDEEEEDEEKRLKCNNLSPESRQPDQSLKAQCVTAAECGTILETSFEYNEATLKLSGKAHSNISTFRKEISSCAQAKESHALPADEEEGPDTERSSFYVETLPAPLASPDPLSELSSLCSRNSIRVRDQLAKLQSRTEESIGVQKAVGDNFKADDEMALSPRSHAKTVKFQFRSPGGSPPYTSPAHDGDFKLPLLQCDIQATRTHVISESVQCEKKLQRSPPSPTSAASQTTATTSSRLSSPCLNGVSPSETLPGLVNSKSPRRRDETLLRGVGAPSAPFSDFNSQEATVV